MSRVLWRTYLFLCCRHDISCTYNETSATVLVCSTSGNLNMALPVVAKLADQIQRPSNENGVAGSSLRERLVERLFGRRDYCETRGVVRSDFRQARCGNGASGARLGENDLGRMGKKLAGNFVDGFVTKGSVDNPNFAPGEVLLEELSELARRAGIVRSIQVNVRPGLQLFKASRPNGAGNALGDVLI